MSLTLGFIVSTNVKYYKIVLQLQSALQYRPYQIENMLDHYLNVKIQLIAKLSQH